MRRIKRIELLQAKEKLRLRRSTARLEEIKADEKKCSEISSDLGLLVNTAAMKKESLNSGLYMSERAIIHKMMDQKEIMANRLEFLKGEKQIIIEELNKSKYKDKVFGQRKEKLRKDYLEKKQILIEDEVSSTKRS
tara:strand:- start:863 stop:1270 length:408 start_codon:yes stop_codon:yes gene_type:complete